VLIYRRDVADPTFKWEYTPGAMTGENQAPPKYNPALVAQVVLEVAVELHPEHLRAGELALKIVGDPDDEREMETAIEAIRDLMECGLFSGEDDGDVVEPTPAALRAYALLAG
jgi:hypothetical protein